MNIPFTRRFTEGLTAANRALGEIAGRIEALESAPTAIGDFDGLRVQLGAIAAQLELSSTRADTLEAAVGDLQHAHKEIIVAVSEGIERTDRAERRIKATVKRARSELAERGLLDPALESEDHELREVDGGKGKRDGLQPMRTPVAPAAEEPSSIRGVPVVALRRVRGF